MLTKGGAELLIDGQRAVAGDDREYDGIYRRFATLNAEGRTASTSHR